MSGLGSHDPGLVRLLKFNLVGAVGIVVQLGMLAMLRSVLNVDYLLATALAVEAAVLHNFVWHEAFTWSDRRAKNRLKRLLIFNFTTGTLSICSNLFAMKLLVGIWGVNYLPANLLSITVCSVLNFLISDRAVFAVKNEGAP